MATIRLNSITQSLQGSIGGLVFRQVNGQTIVTGKPRSPKKQSQQQRENRMKFKAASNWAKWTTRDPEKKAYYLRMAKKLKLPNAYTAAICDYMRKAELKEVDTKHYKGNAGDVMRIKVSKKDFAVREVKVVITNATGTLIESGTAVKKDGNMFIYKASKSVEGQSSVKINVRIADFSGTYPSLDMNVAVAERG